MVPSPSVLDRSADKLILLHDGWYHVDSGQTHRGKPMMEKNADVEAMRGGWMAAGAMHASMLPAAGTSQEVAVWSVARAAKRQAYDEAAV